MEHPWIEWESAAEEVLDATRTSAPVDAFALATACEFEVKPHDGRDAELRGDTIFVNVKMRRRRQHMRIAHELGHFALQRHGIEDSEWGAKWAGGAMLMPRRAMTRDLPRTAWSATQLQALHPNASATGLAVRITQLRDAVMTLLDPRGHRKPWRVWSPWIHEPRLRRASTWERELAARAYEERAELRGDELCYALPLLETDDPAEHRVLVVCDLEQLLARL